MSPSRNLQRHLYGFRQLLPLLECTDSIVEAEAVGLDRREIDRLNQLDIRVAKVLKFGGRRAMIGLDLYNALNSSAILTYNTAYVPGGPWLQPISVLTARLARVSVEFSF